MANVYAVKSGSWSDVSLWNTGALPTSADDVYSNNFTVTINGSFTVLTIRNGSATGINAGGTFIPANGSNLTCTASTGVIMGTAAVMINLTLGSGQSATINANMVGANAAASMIAVNNSGTLNINGNVQAGSNPGGNNYGILFNAGGTINIKGNLTAGTANNCFGANFSSFGVLSIEGTCSGTNISCVNGGGNTTVIGTVTTSGAGHGIINGNVVNVTGTVTTASSGNGIQGGSVVTITGNVTSSSSGVGVNNSSTGTINITGTATGGSSTGNAFVNSSTGTINHVGTAQASSTAPAIGAGAVGQVTILTGPLLSTDATYAGASSSGVNPCIALRWFPKDTALSTFYYGMRSQTVSGLDRSTRTLYLTDAYSSSYPSTANVRNAITYGPTGIYTGTCIIPPSGAVALGVPVDAGIGTAYVNSSDLANALSSVLTTSFTTTLNQQTSTLTTPGSIGERLKLVSTVATTAQQLSDALSNE